MIKPTAKPVNQLPKGKQVKREPVAVASTLPHSEHSQRRSKQYHESVIERMNPTKTKPNSLTVTSYPGLAN